MTYTEIAEVAYYACREARKIMLHDGSLDKEWWDLTSQTKKDYVAGVEYVMNNRTNTPAQVHEGRITYLKNQGWLYGEETNHKLRISSDIVSYDKLPKEKKVDVHLFTGVVLSLVLALDTI